MPGRPSDTSKIMNAYLTISLALWYSKIPFLGSFEYQQICLD